MRQLVAKTTGYHTQQEMHIQLLQLSESRLYIQHSACRMTPCAPWPECRTQIGSHLFFTSANDRSISGYANLQGGCGAKAIRAKPRNATRLILKRSLIWRQNGISRCVMPSKIRLLRKRMDMPGDQEADEASVHTSYQESAFGARELARTPQPKRCLLAKFETRQ